MTSTVTCGGHLAVHADLAPRATPRCRIGSDRSIVVTVDVHAEWAMSRLVTIVRP